MEDWSTSLMPSWLLAVLLFLVGAYYYYTWHYGVLESLGAVVPKPYYPVIGHMKMFLESNLIEMQKKLHAGCGKIAGFYAGRIPFMSITDVDVARRILIKDFDIFTDRQDLPARGPLTKGLFDAKGEHWRILRHTMSPTFTSSKLNQMQPLIDLAGDRFVDNMGKLSKSGEEFDAKELCGAFTLDVIASVAFGLDLNSQQDKNNKFVSYSRKILDINLNHPVFLITVMLPFMNPLLDYFGVTYVPYDSTSFFTKIIKDTMKERRQGFGNRVDFLQLLMDAKKLEGEEDGEDLEEMKSVPPVGRKSKELTEEDILAQSLLFFAAGYDTTANTMSFLLYNLALNPEVQDKLVAEIDDVMAGKTNPTKEDMLKMPYLEMCIYETLRRYPPVTSVERTAAQDFEYKGVKIPKGMTVTVPFWLLQNDPEVWPEPEKFQPERFSPEVRASRDPMYFMPFGIGPRQCIGMRLALIEMKMAIAKMFLKYKVIRCQNTQVPLKLKNTALTTPEHGITLKVVARN